MVTTNDDLHETSNKSSIGKRGSINDTGFPNGNDLIQKRMQAAGRSNDTNAAMSVFQKYSEMQDSIETCRTEGRKIQSEIQSIQNHIQNSKDTRDREETSIKQQEIDSKKFQENYSRNIGGTISSSKHSDPISTNDCDSVESKTSINDAIATHSQKKTNESHQITDNSKNARNADAWMAHEDAIQELDRWISRKKYASDEALQESIQFRTRCVELRRIGLECGLRRHDLLFATTQALRVMNGLSNGECNSNGATQSVKTVRFKNDESSVSELSCVLDGNSNDHINLGRKYS